MFEFCFDRIDYEICWITDRTAAVSVIVQITAPAALTLAAAVKVDGMELLPSCPVRIDGGTTRTSLKALKIVNPRKHRPDDEPEVNRYEIEVMLRDGNGREQQQTGYLMFSDGIPS